MPHTFYLRGIVLKMPAVFIVLQPTYIYINYLNETIYSINHYGSPFIKCRLPV